MNRYLLLYLLILLTWIIASTILKYQLYGAAVLGEDTIWDTMVGLCGTKWIYHVGYHAGYHGGAMWDHMMVPCGPLWELCGDAMWDTMWRYVRPSDSTMWGFHVGPCGSHVGGSCGAQCEIKWWYHLGPCGSFVRYHLRHHVESCGDMWDHVGTYGSYVLLYKAYRTMWGHVEPCGAM